ncbi:MAG: DUF2076 domain-containing protein [Acidobacteriaceae bacterium]|nr:DUF2076 domain-containing protein [Acidobacteriaceae bacterium]MBV9781933.1 DUF2076 domain-containing protein [Acidobacteriaceae bacterium]
MTADERKMLSDLAEKIARTPAPPKDPEAEEFIRTRIGSRSDALYLMTQTVLIQNLALEHAQQQIQQLQDPGQAGQAASGGSFLGQQSEAPRPAYATVPSGQQYGTAPPPQYLAPSPAGPSPSGAPSFLRGAAQTAMGVAAGALAFEGIRSLFSHPGYGGAGFGGFGGAGFGGGPTEETVNNYYGTPGGNDLGPSGDYQASGPNTGDDVYAPDDTTNVGDTSGVEDVSNVDDSAQFDDSGQYDDSGDLGDSGGFDDSGTNFV